jgi:hypothetical protein
MVCSTVSQVVPMVVVVKADAPSGQVVPIEFTVTVFASGDWEVAGPRASVPEFAIRGTADTFERSLAAYLLRIRRAALVGVAKAYDGMDDASEGGIVAE